MDQKDIITDVDLSKEMKEAYLQYSMSVIVGRALPDVRDGLKPVHRRVLFAQSDLSNAFDKPYKKSARVLGDVIGKYHPHGETAVYDAIVRLAQDFSLRYPLIDGQGNFGSIDGDMPAASRYTEVRMTRLAGELLEDLYKDTVPFIPNYDDSLQIPAVLPAKFPNLLVNGSSGIAVGMATNIPPHNLGEVVNACIALTENPNLSIQEISRFIPGPDFPSYGVIEGRQGIVKAYETGKGVITIKAVAEIVEQKGQENIIITEIPYQVNKARMIESIADLVKNKKIEGITDIRDESSREGIRVVINVRRNTNASVILNRLYKYTQMQISFGIIMLAVDRKNQPILFNIKNILLSFINHRRIIVTRRCIYELNKCQSRIHILYGLIKALNSIDEVIQLIKGSAEVKAAQQSLMKKFDLSEKQSKSILEMRLQRLTALERDKIDKELKELEAKIKELKETLGDVHKIHQIIIDELKYIKENYNDKRRTQILDSSSFIEDEDLIPKESMVVTLTQQGYIKRIPSDQYKTQKRGGKGLIGIKTKEEDYVEHIFNASTLTQVLFFTNKGRVHWLKVYQLPVGKRETKGKSIINLLSLSKEERVQAVLPVEEFRKDQHIVMLTSKGIIKKTSLQSFSRPRASGIIAIKMDYDDKVISVDLCDDEKEIFSVTRNGMCICFKATDVRSMGRGARGVKAIKLKSKDSIVGMKVFSREEVKNKKGTFLIITELGYGKRVFAKDYKIQNRSGKGVITQKITGRVGHVVGVQLVWNHSEIILTTAQGQVIRMRCKDISVISKNTQGVRLIKLKGKEEKVKSLSIVKDNEVTFSE